VKWVNDILRGGRKIAGILTEAAFTGDGKMDYAVLGVGVNLTPPPGGFPEEIAHIAGTAFDAEIPDGRERLLAAFLAEFFALYGELSRPDAAYLAEYRRRCCVPGRRVTVLPLGGEPYEAFAEGIDEECRLIIRLPDGQKKVISTGEVSLRL